jgi:hypothetical protein
LYQGYAYNGDFYTNAIDCHELDPLLDTIHITRMVDFKPYIQKHTSDAITIYPNPFVESFNISIANEWQLCDLRIYSMIGELVFEDQIVRAERSLLQIEPRVQPGAYMVSASVDCVRHCLILVCID